MKSAKTIEKQITKHQEAIAKLTDELHAARGDKELTCGRCKEIAAISKLPLTIHSTFTFDMDSDAHEFENYLFKCIRCATYNRLLPAWVSQYVRSFKSVERTKAEAPKYDELPTPWVNYSGSYGRSY